ncbi:MAG: HNH endonuclease signature motif containing protein [Cyanobacteria bacterium P01_A01_bin.17]
MNPRYRQVAQRAGHRCEYCRAPEVIFNFSFEVEHIIPTSKDGKDTEDNWALACRSCNLYKSAHINGFDSLEQTTVSLFHPRKQTWDDHFRINETSGQIEGITAIGRVTVKRLEMNSQAQQFARQQWMALGLFP